MKFDYSTVYLLKGGQIVCALERKDKQALYEKDGIGYYGAVANSDDYTNDFKEVDGLSEYDVIAYKKFGSQSEALGVLLTSKPIINWDWERPAKRVVFLNGKSIEISQEEYDKLKKSLCCQDI